MTFSVAAKLAAVAALEAVRVVVDMSPTMVKFSAPVMLSELPDTAPVDDSVAPVTVPAVSGLSGWSAFRVGMVAVLPARLTQQTNLFFNQAGFVFESRRYPVLG